MDRILEGMEICESSIITPLVLKIAECEVEYVCNGCTRDDLEEYVHDVRTEYERLTSHPHGGDRYHLALLLLSLERVRASLVLEDEIIEVIDHETSIFDNNITKITEEMTRSCGMLSIHTSDSDSKYSREGSLLKSKRTNYPKQVSHILRKWLQDNVKNPYPSDSEKTMLREKTGLDATQLNNWFINARRRILPLLRENISSFSSKKD